MCRACGKWCWTDELEAGPDYMVRAGETGYYVAVIRAASLVEAVMKKQRLQAAAPGLVEAAGDVWFVGLATAADLHRFYTQHDRPRWDRL